MAGVRDPAFWRRFSMAVHQDEEHKLAPHPTMAAPSSRPELKHTCVHIYAPIDPKLTNTQRIMARAPTEETEKSSVLRCCYHIASCRDDRGDRSPPVVAESERVVHEER
jgi:hypothetical protein